MTLESLIVHSRAIFWNLQWSYSLYVLYNENFTIGSSLLSCLINFGYLLHMLHDFMSLFQATVMDELYESPHLHNFQMHFGTETMSSALFSFIDDLKSEMAYVLCDDFEVLNHESFNHCFWTFF